MMMQLPHLSKPHGNHAKLVYSPSPRFAGRWKLFALGTMSFALGLWIASVEIIRPHFPSVAGQKTFTPTDRSRAELAARLGVMRGDLWEDDALINSGLDFGTLDGGISPAADAMSFRAAAHSLALSPLNSKMWLILALHALQQPHAAQTREGDLNGVAVLEMAYLTGQLNLALLPARISIAARSNALTDTSIQDFVQMDVTTIFTKAPNLKPALLAAYQSSSLAARLILKQLIIKSDPTFLKTEEGP